MKMIKCEACQEVISKKAAVCPKCGHPNKKSKDLSGRQIIGGLFLAGIAVWFFAGGGLEHQATKSVQKLEDQVAVDAVNQYNIAKREGDPIQICVQAGLVSAAYLQAENEAKYQQWKKVQKADCQAAGVPL